VNTQEPHFGHCCYSVPFTHARLVILSCLALHLVLVLAALALRSPLSDLLQPHLLTPINHTAQVVQAQVDGMIRCVSLERQQAAHHPDSAWLAVSGAVRHDDTHAAVEIRPQPEEGHLVCACVEKQADALRKLGSFLPCTAAAAPRARGALDGTLYFVPPRSTFPLYVSGSLLFALARLVVYMPWRLK